MKKILSTILGSICGIFLLVNSAFAFTVRLAWDANTEPDLAGYRVYVSQESGVYDPNNFYEVGLDGYAGFTIPDEFVDGVMHYFVVTAYDLADQESGYSNEVYSYGGAVDDPPPSSPSGCYVHSVIP